jgi:predicted KAP-like P-loop ATPase
MWSDNETSDDLIGFQVHADLVRSVVTDDKMLPVTVGVFGDWGSGKTSIMKMLQRDLDPERWGESNVEPALYKDIAVVYFNGWLFEGYDDAKSAILSSILLALGDHKRFGPKIRDNALSLLKSVDWMRVAKFGMKHVVIPAAAAAATGGLAAIPAVVGASVGLSHPAEAKQSHESGANKDKDDGSWFKAKEEEHAFNVRTFRERFSKLLQDSDIKTLVVLIDDLDRCSPERVIENLEAIKLFLSVPSTAFVIGADPRIVEHAIRLRYAERSAQGGSEENNRLVKDYLEKVIQVPYRLPRLSSSEIETYMSLLFCRLYLGEADADRCINQSKKEREANRYSAFGYAKVKETLGKEPSASLSESLTFSSAAAPLIADGLEGNPRQVKRFLNAFILRKKLAAVAKLDHIKDDVLVKLMILEYTNDELFRELFTLQSRQAGFPAEIIALEKAVFGGAGYEEATKGLKQKWQDRGVRQWVALKPTLGAVDLRDYFWIARDKLDATFAGLSMVSPLTRTVLTNLMSGNAPQRNIGLDTAPELSGQELGTLYDLLEQAITRQPDDKKGYDAMRLLMEKKVSGAGERFNEILLKVPFVNANISAGTDVGNLMKAHPEFQAVLQSALDRLSESKEKIGAAYKTTLKGGKK